MHALRKTIAVAALIALALSPAACASEPGSESGVGTGTDSQSAGDGDDVGSVGSIDSSSESTASGNTSVTMGSGDGDGDGTVSSATMGDGDEAGDGDSSGDGDSTSNSGTGDGDGNGDGDGDGAPGSDKFPGDLCDPFIDTCIDFEGTDYVCGLDYDFIDSQYEHNFKCFPFSDQYGDGFAASQCMGESGLQNNTCQTGFYCAPLEWLPKDNCDYFECCSPLCVYGDVCSDGSDCFVTYFESQLTDYLDIYTGIGFCPSG